MKSQNYKEKITKLQCLNKKLRLEYNRIKTTKLIITTRKSQNAYYQIKKIYKTLKSQNYKISTRKFKIMKMKIQNCNLKIARL